jgi:heat shock protein HslJ
MYEKQFHGYLLGEWKLKELEVNGVIVHPKKIDYYLTIEQDRVGYNLDINKCWVDSFYIDREKIRFSMIACTEACCDGQLDSIPNYLDYSGTYSLQDSILIINNSTSILRLIKQ